jgi:hypothetical protein
MYRDDNDDNDGNSDDATDDDEKKPPPKKKMRHYRPVNDNIKEEEEEEEAYNTTTNDIHDNDIGKSNKEGDDEEGYESWTEGNWCLILPFPPAVVDEIETAGPSATTRRRRVVRNRNSSHQQSYEEDGGKCNEDYNDDNDDDDDDDDDDDVSSANSKTRKGKIMRYTKLQNERWDESFQRLVVTYRKEHKYINVPQRYAADPTLGSWVCNQRHYYKNKELSVNRIRRLESIGFVWKLKDIVPWEGMYQKLAAYKKQHKSANVPQRYAADPTLGSWVSNQRYYYKNKVLSVKRMRRLDSIGFAWKLKDIVPWEEMYQRLVAYKKQHKSTNVPRKHQLHLKLGEWVHNQRNCYTKKEISVERIKRLDSIGFVWKLKDIVSWDEMYLRLVAYKKKHKSTNIPFRYEADPRLGQWVSTQRKYHSNKTLSIERINRLDSICFVWAPDDARWMEMYSKLVEYKKQNKSTRVPHCCAEDPPLGKWVHRQRTTYKNSKMSGKRLKLLNSINFAWSAMKAS